MEPFIANGHDIIVALPLVPRAYYLRYALWGMLGAPWLFVSMRLASRKAREGATA